MKTTKISTLLALSFAAAFLTGESSADTLLDVPGPTFGYANFGSAALADSWTQSFAVTDASISVLVQGADPSGGPVNFYLTNAIGPTATLSNLVAFTSMQMPFALTSVTPFANLNLAAGTYYLVMADYGEGESNPIYGADWNYLPTAASGIQTASGLTLNSMLTTSGALSMFAPASNFVQESLPLQGVISYTGTEASTVSQAPEMDPSAATSAASLLVGTLLVLRSRRRADRG
jgi:hypothetical protein